MIKTIGELNSPSWDREGAAESHDLTFVADGKERVQVSVLEKTARTDNPAWNRGICRCGCYLYSTNAGRRAEHSRPREIERQRIQAEADRQNREQEKRIEQLNDWTKAWSQTERQRAFVSAWAKRTEGRRIPNAIRPRVPKNHCLAVLFGKGQRTYLVWQPQRSLHRHGYHRELKGVWTPFGLQRGTLQAQMSL